jgi:hypothetical protein
MKTQKVYESTVQFNFAKSIPLSSFIKENAHSCIAISFIFLYFMYTWGRVYIFVNYFHHMIDNNFIMSHIVVTAEYRERMHETKK